MTDITEDQEREVQRILNQMKGSVNNAPGYTGNPREWLRDLRAIFPEPAAPTLAEELIRMANEAQDEERFTDEKDLSDLARRAEQIEQERDQLSEELAAARGIELKAGEAYLVNVDGRPCNAVVQSRGGRLGFALGGGWIAPDDKGITIGSKLVVGG